VQRWVGASVEVLLEREATQGIRGVSENYLKVLVAGVPRDLPWQGRIVKAHIEAGVDPRFASGMEPHPRDREDHGFATFLHFVH